MGKVLAPTQSNMRPVDGAAQGYQPYGPPSRGPPVAKPPFLSPVVRRAMPGRRAGLDGNEILSGTLQRCFTPPEVDDDLLFGNLGDEVPHTPHIP